MLMQIEALLEHIEFLLIAGIVLVLAILALEHKDLVYAVFFFGIMASFVAGFFLLLEAPFVAGMQIAVYTGGISVLIIFGVLLLPIFHDTTRERFETIRKKRLGIVLSIFVIILSGSLVFLFTWPTEIPAVNVDLAQSLEGLAQWLWGNHGIYVQFIAIIILTSLIGSLAILKLEKAEHLNPESGVYGLATWDDDTSEKAKAGNKSEDTVPVIMAQDAEEEGT